MNNDKLHSDAGTDLQHLCQEGYTEEAWIDYLIGTEGSFKRTEMSRHLARCPACQKRCEQWQELLLPDKDGKMTLASDLRAIDDTTQIEQVMKPSKRIYKKLRFRVRMLGIRRSAGRFLSAKRRLVIALGAVCILLAAVGGIMRMNDPETEWNSYVKTYEPAAMNVMSSPDSEFYPISLGRPVPKSGVVWYNSHSGELLMLVGGLIPREDQVVRVWAVREGSRDDLGVLQYHAYRAHLYVRDRVLDQADIILSIEPKSGPFDLSETETISVGITGATD
ncbi:anti-sigma factor domain-containing protein [Paenibacillus sp. GM2]|uniref:anti-sigma factor domain-containing protein n=1 Tax=Paenibacillus sp. GM2 TaxID=1622070 RepID=UPI000838F3AC|nr:anti-sigma factor [Paenibacillus sp. GM2]